MPSVQTYLEYNDPNIVVWRSGRPGDEYKTRMDSLPVINGIVTLLEIPSETDKVQVAGFTEISQDTYKRKTYIGETEFLVNYTTGIVMFNSIHEGKTFVFNYKGKGVVLLAASRVYAMVQRNPDIVVTLQDYIDGLKVYTQNLDLKLIEINKAIATAQQVTEIANVAADNANQAAQFANQAAQEALNAAESVVVIRKDPVDTFDDLAIVYPNPENGWQVTINTTGDIYRYDGVVSHQWQLVGNYLGGSIPYVSEDSDGLLHKEDYQNFILRRVLFKIPKIIDQGVQYVVGFSQIPFDGEIVNVKADCVESGISVSTQIGIEKISENEFLSGTWDNIFSNNLSFEPNNTIATGGVVEDVNVKKGDYFRINVYQYDGNIKGITVNLDIKTKFNNLEE